MNLAIAMAELMVQDLERSGNTHNHRANHILGSTNIALVLGSFTV